VDHADVVVNTSLMPLLAVVLIIIIILLCMLCVELADYRRFAPFIIPIYSRHLSLYLVIVGYIS